MALTGVVPGKGKLIAVIGDEVGRLIKLNSIGKLNFYFLSLSFIFL